MSHDLEDADSELLTRKLKCEVLAGARIGLPHRADSLAESDADATVFSLCLNRRCARLLKKVYPMMGVLVVWRQAQFHEEEVAVPVEAH
jgi:hypothetical protein